MPIISRQQAGPREQDLPRMEVEVSGRAYPWFLAPYEAPARYGGGIVDGLEEERELYDRILGRIGRKPKPAAGDELRSLSRRLYELSDVYYIHRHFRIRDKSFQMVPFDHWNKGQQRIYWARLWQRKTGRPVRVIVLKPRQTGVSTEICAFTSADTFLYGYRETACITDKKTHTTNIFNMAVGFYDSLSHPETGLHSADVPQLQRCSQRNENAELILGAHMRNKQRARRQTEDEAAAAGPVLNSKYLTFTAKAIGREHSYTVSNLHGSEVPYWGPKAEETWLGFAAAIPDRPQTAQYLEGTANGSGDWFSTRWEAAELGTSQFLPVFFGWYDFGWSWDHESQRWIREYSTELPLEYRDEEGRKSYLRTLTAKEEELVELYDVTLEQIEWRRRAIVDKCSDDEAKFCQEYPTTAAEAFIASSSNVFPAPVVEHYMEQTSPVLESNQPVWVGNFHWDPEKDPLWDERRDGWTRIWRRPEWGKTYDIGADPAAGEDQRSDFCSAQVLLIPEDPQERIEQVAHCWCNGGVEAFAEQLACLYLAYGEPLLVPESTGLGLSLILQLQTRFNVFNLYRRRVEDKVGNQIQLKHGFSTNSRTKGAMVGQLRRYLREKTVLLHDRVTALQIKNYVQRPNASKKGLAYGPSKMDGQDDALDALGLAIMGIISEQTTRSTHIPGVEPPKELKKRRQGRSRGLDRDVRVDPRMGAVF